MKKRIVTAVKQRFSIRKLSIGAASVLLGTSLYFMGVSAPVVHADTIDEPAASSGKTDSSDPVSVANDSKYSDVDVNNAIDQYAEDVKTKLENNGNKVIIRPSDKQPVTVNTTKDRADQVNNIKQKIDQANQSWDAINTCKKSNNKQIKDGKDSDYFENQSLSVDDEKKSEINQITVDGKGTTLLKGQSKNIDGIDIIHTTHMTDKEREAMKVNSNNKVIVNFQPDQCSNKEITVTYNNLKNSYYLKNINDETSRIKISRIDRTFSSIQAAENPKLFYGGWRGNKYDNYDPCNGPQLIIYNDPSDGFFYNNIQQISVKDTYYYDDKGEQKQIIFDTKDPAWVFVTSLNSNGGGNIEKVRALDSNDSPLNAQKIAGSTVTDHNDGWCYSDNNNNFSNANNIFGQKLDWDNNDEYNRFGFVGTAAFQYQPGMTLQYRSDDSQWGSHWACMQTQVVSSLNENVIIRGHIKDETESVAGNDTVTRTIHYLYDNGKTAKPDKTQTVSFNVTGIKDDVTGKTTWDGDAQAVDPVTTPSITGYTPDKLSIEGQDFKFGDKDVEVTVTYTANTQTAKITYIDDTTKTKLDSKDTSGKFGQTITFATAPADEIENYKKQGYVFVSNNFDNQTYQAVDSNNVFEVHFKHGIVTVTTKNPQTLNTPINPDPHSPKYPKDISNTNSDVKRTIDYKFKNGKNAQPTVKDSLHFERTVVIDKVTGDVLSDTWTQSQNFNDVQTPVMQGYTPDRTAVSDKNIGHDHQDIIEHVVYSPDTQHMTITYIDDTTGETLHTDNPTGVSDQDAKYTTSDTIKKYEDQHYKLVSDSTKGQDLIFDHDDNANQTYEVHFVHGSHTINQNTSPKQTIHYVYADDLARQGKAADDNVQQLSFKRDGYNDEVTGIDHWNAWTPANNNYNAVDSPVIQGYTPDKLSVDGSTVNPTDNDIEVTVVYNADKQVARVIYIDKATNTTLASKDLSGKSDEDSEYNTKDTIGQYQSQHYVLAGDETDGNNVIFDHDDQQDQTYYVYFVHDTQKVSRQSAVTSTIDYKFADGKTAQPTVTQTKYFNENGVKDLVTGKITWDESTPQKFDDIATKSIVGYTPDKDNVTGSTVKFGDSDIEVTVTYYNNAQKAVITYVDDVTKKTLVSDSQDGKFDHEITFEHDPAEVINSLKEKGYKLVSNDFKDGTKYKADDKQNEFIVHLTHDKQKVNRQDQVVETIHYVYENGSNAQPDHEQTISFTEDGIKDKVTDQIDWTSATPQKFDDVTTPTIVGYTPDEDNVTGSTVNFGDKDIEVTVTYHNNAQIAKITYIDDTAKKTLDSDTQNGKFNHVITFEHDPAEVINSLKEKGYKLVSNDFNNNNYQADNSKNVFYVHFVHGSHDISDKKAITETITYKMSDGSKASDKVEKQVEFSRVGKHDEVTNTDTWNEWQPDKQSFNAVPTPDVTGYTPDIKSVEAKTVTAGDKDIAVIVTYTPNQQKAKVLFIDDTAKNTLDTHNLIGVTNGHEKYNPSEEIDKFVHENYVFVSSDYPEKGFTYDNDDSKDQVFEIHLKHGSHAISDKDSITETVTYKMSDGSKASDKVEKQVEFSRDGYNDEVTKQDHWNKWQPNKQSFSAVQTPNVTGYTPDIKSVEAKTVTAGDKNITVTITYSPDKQKAKVVFIDDTTKKILDTHDLIGVTNSHEKYNPSEEIDKFVHENYVFVSSDYPEKGFTYDNDDSKDQVFEVHLKEIPTESDTPTTPDNTEDNGGSNDTPTDSNNPEKDNGGSDTDKSNHKTPVKRNDNKKHHGTKKTKPSKISKTAKLTPNKVNTKVNKFTQPKLEKAKESINSVNRRESKHDALPQTGEKRSSLMAMLGLAILDLGMIGLMKSKKRKNN